MVAILVLLTIVGFLLVDWLTQMAAVWHKERQAARELARQRAKVPVRTLATPERL